MDFRTINRITFPCGETQFGQGCNPLMRTALFLLAEFVLFALGAITALLGVIIVLRVPLTLDVLSLSTAGIMLLLFTIPYGFFKAAGAVNNRRKWGLIIKDTRTDRR